MIACVLLIILAETIGCTTPTWDTHHHRNPAQTEKEDPASINWGKTILNKEEVSSNFQIFCSEFETTVINELFDTWRSRLERGITPEGEEYFPEERAAIDYYKKELGYREINSFLRGRTDFTRSTTAIISAAKLITSGLNRMKGARHYKDKTVYRGAYLSEELISTYTEGHNVTEHAFTSTSIEKNIAEQFAYKKPTEGKRRVLFIIQSQTGKIITAGVEAEVLFIPFSQFKVVSKKTLDNWVIINMVEVDSQRISRNFTDLRRVSSHSTNGLAQSGISK